ncbi:splicing regulator SDE2 [Ochlerotatus camptorhynchus]|uniref:splicing regulator SDE2 n=1 Tax=Ochlerotatus camptorhynchus TaxID=644619 RepID=UPI0031D60AB3
MLEIIHNHRSLRLTEGTFSDGKLQEFIRNQTGLLPCEYYLTHNGKRFDPQQISTTGVVPLRLVERLPGGKGGFGSMLRAIGAQIEKTTNREACRDLSGRRLRDINEEKRLKAYLDKQKEAPEDERVKLQKKIDKLLAKPKHVFHDEEYNRSRTDLTQNVGEAVQEGFRKAIEGEAGVKRKAQDDGKKGKGVKKKAKGALWLGSDDLGSSSDSSDTDSEADSACSSGGEKSSEGASSSTTSPSSSVSAKQMVTSEDEASNQDKGKSVEKATSPE